MINSNNKISLQKFMVQGYKKPYCASTAVGDKSTNKRIHKIIVQNNKSTPYIQCMDYNNFAYI
jgi:hypothetical protein